MLAKGALSVATDSKPAPRYGDISWERMIRAVEKVRERLRRADLPAAIGALSKSGFIHRHTAGLEMFLDGPSASPRDAVHIIFAAEKVRPDYLISVPEVGESEAAG